MVQRRAFKQTGPGGNPFVNYGRDKSSAPISGPVKKSKPVKADKNTRHYTAAPRKGPGVPISKKRYDKGGPIVTDPDFGSPRGTSFGPNYVKSLRARWVKIRLATKYKEFQPNYQPDPSKAKRGDFGVIKKKKGTEANPVNQNLRPAPKTPHSNKFMNKRLFAKDRKKEQLDHHVKNKEGWDEIKREAYEEPQPAYPEEIEAAKIKKSVYGKKDKKKKRVKLDTNLVNEINEEDAKNPLNYDIG